MLREKAVKAYQEWKDKTDAEELIRVTKYRETQLNDLRKKLYTVLSLGSGGVAFEVEYESEMDTKPTIVIEGLRFRLHEDRHSNELLMENICKQCNEQVWESVKNLVDVGQVIEGIRVNTYHDCPTRIPIATQEETGEQKLVSALRDLITDELEGY